jgi:mono/diheme cytochrome c family protein
MRHHGILLILAIGIAAGVTACGRANKEDIDQALGITPTPTPSASQLATGTAAAAAAAKARTAAAVAASTPGGREAAAVGDVIKGSRQFLTQCSGCHRPGGAGPDILSPGSAGTDVTAENLLPLIRQGKNHAVPPGPYKTTEITDKAVIDIAAYISSKAAP